jgi:hypothetical protein
VDVIEVTHEVVLVAQRVLPISPLPNPALASGGAAGRDPFGSGQIMRKAAFDQARARGEIRIAIGQGPDRVQVIREDHGGFDREGMPSAHPAKRGPLYANVVRQQCAPAIGQIYREEITASRQEIPPIVCHSVPSRLIRWVSLRSSYRSTSSILMPRPCRKLLRACSMRRRKRGSFSSR